VKIWRIAAETRNYAATDLSGAGAAKSPGRWNKEGEPVVYAAQSIALAVLETAAHIDSAGLPLNRFVVEINILDKIWAARVTLTELQLPATWSAIPAGQASIDVGSQWLSSAKSALLLVPSVIVPEEMVVLVNPKHSDSQNISATVIRAFEYDRLFRS